MNLTAVMIKPICIACLFFAGAAQANEIESLKQALLCKGDPLAAVRSLVGTKNYVYSTDYVGYSFGEGEDEREVVILSKPLMIEKSQATAVIAELSSSYLDFNGIVYGRFIGDYQTLVKALRLIEVKDDHSANKTHIGKFEKRTTIGSDGKEDDTCPMVIGLTPLLHGEFLLGCGWCNG